MDAWMYAASSNSNARTYPEQNTSPQNYSLLASLTRDDPSPGGDGGQGKGGNSRVRRRNRLITSCLECRRRKLKCDKQAPCTNCTRFKRGCLYLAPSLDPDSQQKLADLKEKMGALEKNLEREVANQTQKGRGESVNAKKASVEQSVEDQVDDDDDDDDDIPGDDEGDELEPTPWATLDNIYEGDADDELVDLGVQLGKMRITERIGGWARPKIVQELNDTLNEVTAEDVKKSVGMSATNLTFDGRPKPPAPKIQASQKSYIGPGPDYIAPSAGLFFPGTNMNTTLIDYLPTKSAADQLIDQYWNAVHYICKIVHRPTFEAQYTLFWNQIAIGSEPVPPVQAVIFAAMFSAAVSMGNDQVTRVFGTSRDALIDSLRSGTEMALAKANFLRTTKVDTMQAFVMYLIPLIRAEVSRAHSALVGTAIRLAECMGLHRDGSLYGMAPVEVHVRRMIWHQLCFLDMKTCDATGPRPQIRKDDYDTKFPLNVNDVDLMGPHPATEDKVGWTDTTLMRIRAEGAEIRRILFYDAVQVDKKKKTLTSLVVKAQKYIDTTQAKYSPMIDQNIPIQALGKLILDLTTKSVHIQILHRYLFSRNKRIPDRLRQILIEAGLANMENSIAFETNPQMQEYVWYRGALNVYHVALLLLIEVYAYPMRKEAARIWRCLDYIFEVPSHLAPKQKAELILTDLRDRMAVYNETRKLRASRDMVEKTSAAHSWPRPPEDGGVGAAAVVDAAGQMRQEGNLLAPTQYSPAQGMSSESPGSGSRAGSLSVDAQMSMMDDIDWAEFDKVFNPAINTGDLNVPDFNMADFTGDFAAAASMDPMAYAAGGLGFGGGTGFVMPSAQDLAEVRFTPTLIPNVMDDSHEKLLQRQRQQQQQGQEWSQFRYGGSAG